MTSEAPAPEPPARDRRDVARVVAAAVVIVAFVVLAAIAIAASRSDFSFTAPPAASARGLAPAPPESTSHSNGVGTPPPSLAARPVSVPSPAAPPAPTDASSPAPPPAVPSEEPGEPCAALGLPAPSQVGGVQSLIRLVPLFGPFSAEAFAMMPAFEPGLRALGPLFPLFERGLDQLAPVLDAVTPPAQQVEQSLYGLIEPSYAPARDDVLAAEAQLAAYLRPIVESLAEAPGTECLVALEGLLASLVP